MQASGVCMSDVGKWEAGRCQRRYLAYPEVLNVLDWDSPGQWGGEITRPIGAIK